MIDDNIKLYVDGYLVPIEDMCFSHELSPYDFDDRMCIRGYVRRRNPSDYERVSSIVDFGIKKVIFNNPATIVMWRDGTKTVVKCQEEDAYEETLGLLYCIAKKAYGNTGRFNDIIRKHVDDRNPLGISESIERLGEVLNMIFGKNSE